MQRKGSDTKKIIEALNNNNKPKSIKIIRKPVRIYDSEVPIVDDNGYARVGPKMEEVIKDQENQKKDGLFNTSEIFILDEEPEVNQQQLGLTVENKNLSGYPLDSEHNTYARRGP